MKNWIAYAGVALALLTALFSAGQRWGELNQRLKALEDQSRYLHGTFAMPTGGVVHDP